MFLRSHVIAHCFLLGIARSLSISLLASDAHLYGYLMNVNVLMF